MLLKRVAKDLGLTFPHVRRAALGDIRSERVMETINAELDAIISRTKPLDRGEELPE